MYAVLRRRYVAYVTGDETANSVPYKFLQWWFRTVQSNLSYSYKSMKGFSWELILKLRSCSFVCEDRMLENRGLFKYLFIGCTQIPAQPNPFKYFSLKVYIMVLNHLTSVLVLDNLQSSQTDPSLICLVWICLSDTRLNFRKHGCPSLKLLKTITNPQLISIMR